jgi:CelD/BcsL family acetyltransferase involved in cellulose biosynthesis
VFRGLQLSFDESLRSYSLGNVMQALMIRCLCDEQAHTYDLGTDLEYKKRWSEPGLRTEVLAVLKP